MRAEEKERREEDSERDEERERRYRERKVGRPAQTPRGGCRVVSGGAVDVAWQRLWA